MQSLYDKYQEEIRNCPEGTVPTFRAWMQNRGAATLYRASTRSELLLRGLALIWKALAFGSTSPKRASSPAQFSAATTGKFSRPQSIEATSASGKNSESQHPDQPEWRRQNPQCCRPFHRSSPSGKDQPRCEEVPPSVSTPHQTAQTVRAKSSDEPARANR